MADNDDDFKSTDERIGDMFSSVIAPSSTPDQDFINQALEQRQAKAMSSGGGGSPAAGVTPTATPTATATSEAEPWYTRQARESSQGGMRAAKAAEDTLAQIPARDAPSEALDTKIQGENKPIQSRDAQGNLLPEYKPSVGRKVLRGFIGAAKGLEEGGVMGAAAGAIDPRDTYRNDKNLTKEQNEDRRQAMGYGAPNKVYQTEESNRQRELGGDLSAVAMTRQRFKDATDRIKGTAQEQRATATAYKDAGVTANTAEERATQAQKERDAANKPAKDPTNELEVIHQEAMRRFPKDPGKAYEWEHSQLISMKQAERAPKDTSASDLQRFMMATDFGMRQTAQVDKAKEDERTQRYKEVDNNILLKGTPEKMAAEKQRIDREIEAKYAPKYDTINAKVDEMRGLTKAGQKVNSAAAQPRTATVKNQPSTAKPSQQPSTPPASPSTPFDLRKGDKFNFNGKPVTVEATAINKEGKRIFKIDGRWMEDKGMGDKGTHMIGEVR